ncbi:MAG: hypothetical protein ACKVH0_20370, partial [Alphaproteobacteria bacterium]
FSANKKTRLFLELPIRREWHEKGFKIIGVGMGERCGGRHGWLLLGLCSDWAFYHEAKSVKMLVGKNDILTVFIYTLFANKEYIQNIA